jgi:hypothetical protein
MSRRLEKMADMMIKLTPDEQQKLQLIIKAKLLPEVAKQQQGLLQQQIKNPQMAQMGKNPQMNMPMPNSRDAALRGLLRG